MAVAACHHDPYRVLGVSPAASDDQVRAAYRRRCRETHPDTAPASGRAATFLDVRAAFDQIVALRAAPPSVLSAALTISTFAAIAGGVGALEVLAEHPHRGRIRLRRSLAVPPALSAGDDVAATVDGMRVRATVEVRPHPLFELAGADVRTKVTVAAHLAQRGGTTRVMSPSGPRPLQVPPGTRHGAVLAVPGAGVRTREAPATCSVSWSSPARHGSSCPPPRADGRWPPTRRRAERRTGRSHG